jgi:hypothetical protein
MMREFGSENRLPLVPAASRTAAIDAGLADAVDLHIRPDELHRVVNGEASRDRPARAVDVEQNVLVGIVRPEEQHLRNHHVRNRVVDWRADENDAVFQQPREDVVETLPPVCLFDDHRDELKTRVAHSH